MPHRDLVARLAWLLCLLSLASSMLHMGVVQHDRCPEHGELIEVRGSLAEPQPGASTSLFAASTSEQHDEHCPLANAAAAPVDHAPQPLAVDRPGAQAGAALERADRAHPSVDALDVAPKQGPPDLAV